jgi:hypothetical protein
VEQDGFVTSHELQLIEQPKSIAKQDNDGEKQGVCDHSWFLSVGSFQSFFPKLPEWHGKRALSPLAIEALQKRAVCSGGGRRWK